MQNTSLTTVPGSSVAHAQALQPPSSQGAGREFLAFKLGGEEYGIDILRVREIRSYEAPTRIANAPDFVMGVINLRGVIVPVVDMRVKLGLASPRYDEFTVVIVLSIGNRVVGMVVDSVCDVITLGAAQMLPVPDFNAHVSAEHLMAIGSLDERMLILVDIERLMTSADMALFNTPAALAH
ncbi:chemotaxis protein CheW [Azohydromonas lata]|uniref:chemotaxis protein CheW n=1 Tax=Azohydromonas lata TaxID=45677 RepID=UPI000A04BF44|nr:chemotaxis protein CheW [Azohydromonas lata]